MQTLARRALFIVCGILCLGSALTTAGTIIWICLREGQVFDFAQEWTSARNFLTGLPVYLDYGRSLEIHFGALAAPAFRYNAHPPGAVLVALPFGLLTYPAAYGAWSMVSLACLAASLLALARFGSGARSPLAAACFLTLIVSGNSLTHQVIQGQLNLLLLALVVGAWLADKRDLPALSGAMIGVAASIKLFPAFLGVYFLGQRKWRGVTGSVLAFLLVNAATCLLLGYQTYHDYWLRVVPDVSRFRDTWPNASFTGFWSKLFDGVCGHVVPLWHSPLLAATLTAVSCLGVAGVSIWGGAKSLPTDEQDSSRNPKRDLAFGLCCVGMLLASPITWDHAFVLLIPAFWFTWHACEGQVACRLLTVILAIVLLWINPATIWETFMPEQFGVFGAPRLTGPSGVLTLVSMQFYALATFYLLVLRVLLRQSGIVASPPDKPQNG